jgi:hypothetical protein
MVSPDREWLHRVKADIHTRFLPGRSDCAAEAGTAARKSLSFVTTRTARHPVHSLVKPKLEEFRAGSDTFVLNKS